MLSRIIFVVSMFGCLTVVQADDYQQWLTLMPKSMDGLALSDKTSGMNSGAPDFQLGMLECIYGTNERSIDILITTQPAAAAVAEATIKNNLNTTTDSLLFKKTKIEGEFATLTIDKTKNDATVSIYAKNKGLIVIAMKPKMDEQHAMAIVKQVPVKLILAVMHGK